MLIALQLFAIAAIVAVMSAVTSCAHTAVLTQPGQIFAPVYRWLDARLNYTNGQRNEEDHWLFKVLVGCEKCNSGQLALWSFIGVVLILYWGRWIVLLLTVPFLFFACTGAILLVTLMKMKYEQFVERNKL